MVRRAVLAATLALTACLALTLGACVPRPTGHGAPPYQEPVLATPAPLHTVYPALHLSFTLPAMAGDDEAAVRAYLRFSTAAFRTWSSGRPSPALVATATPPMRRLVQRLASTQHTYGALDRPTHIEIRRVSTSGVVSGLVTCVRHLGRADPTGVLLVQAEDGRWRVSATGPLHHRLKGCR